MEGEGSLLGDSGRDRWVEKQKGEGRLERWHCAWSEELSKPWLGLSLASAPISFPIILPSRFFPEVCPSSGVTPTPCESGVRRACTLLPTLTCHPRSRSWVRPQYPGHLCSYAQGARISLGEMQARGFPGSEKDTYPKARMQRHDAKEEAMG